MDFHDVAKTPGVEVRKRGENGAPEHPKNYEIDGRLRRTGAANFSVSGIKRKRGLETALY
jgi:hypothetical protein